jgi:hypothetical protein
VNARTLLGIAVASLLTAACGERVQIGSGEIPSPPPPTPPDDVCVNAPCGQPCALAGPCTTTDCPPSPGGYCTFGGTCTLNTPVCPSPGPSCIGLPCGAPCEQCVEPCEQCDPGDPNCGTSTEPPMTCDAFEQCQLGTVSCF